MNNETMNGVNEAIESSSSSPETSSQALKLATLEPFLQKHIFTYLNLASRSRLRQCCTALYRSVEAFDHDLAVSNTPKHGVAFSDSSSSSSSRERDDLKRAREELVAATELKRWMTVTKDKDASSDRSGRIIISPGTPNLRRVEISKRTYRYYDSNPKLIDDHILVLYSNYWYGFEAFDLNTGKALKMVGGMNGPDKNYVNNEDIRINLVLTHYDGRHGLLAAGLQLCCERSDNPHGPWSGPYLTVWDLGVNDYYKNIRMRLDLRKPLYNVAAVSVVAPDKCAVLLLLNSKWKDSSSSTNNHASWVFDSDNVVDDKTAVILQWHRIPLNSDEMSSDPPPPPPPTPPQGDEPDHDCSMSCLMSCPEGDKRRAWRRQKELWDKHVETKNGGKHSKKDKNDDDVEYNWFPGSNTLLGQDKVRQTSPPNDCAFMHSDGKGILVVIAGEVIQFWHVGTMSLVRCCRPFQRDDLDFSRNTVITNFTTCTIVAPKENVEDGEGYEEKLTRSQKLAAQHQKQHHDDRPPALDQNLSQQMPTAAVDATLQFQAESIDSHNTHNISSTAMPNAGAQPSLVGPVQSADFDLVRCDTESILRRFAHENRKQERDFEQGICGILGYPSDGSLIKRATQLPVGACSPQLECVVRVAFSIRSRENDNFNQIVVLDVEPLISIRNRYIDGEDYYTEEYAQACLGQKGLWQAWDTTYSPSSESGCEQMCVFDWSRGGVLDFPEHGESESKRCYRYFSLIVSARTQSEEDRDRLARELGAIVDVMGRGRAPLSLYIDAHKLIVCTGHELSIWPTEIYREINGHSNISLHGCDDLMTLGQSVCEWDDTVSLDVETKPLYAARPVDKQLCNHWHRIACSASDSASNGSFDSEECHTTDTQSIVRDFVTSDLERQARLLREATYYGRTITDAVFSWRYAVTVTSPIDDHDSSREMLSIFDSLGDWARGKHSFFGAEGVVTVDRQKYSLLDDISTKVGIHFPGGRDDNGDDDYYCGDDFFADFGSECDDSDNDEIES